ncbi:MAG: GRAM domain-containing protein, partial [archaeon]|nr:GRAM domain-containing protein [archaeon]
MASSSSSGTVALEFPGFSSSGVAIAWESKIMGKAREMQKKTGEVRQRFGLPGTEQVVQDYYCSVHREKMNHGGRMWITQSYVVFYSGFPFHQSEKLCFKNITDIQQKKKGGLSNIVQITVEEPKLGERKVTFGAFMKTSEAISVLLYLWHNPPLYISLDDTDLRPSLKPEASDLQPSANPYAMASHAGAPSSSGAAGDGWGTYVTAGGVETGGGGWLGMGAAPQQAQAQALRVDTETSASALRTAMDIREMGTETLQELSRQGEVIDMISNTVENIHVNMDRGDRILRGLETFGGGLKNTFTRDQTRGKNLVFERVQRTIHLKSRMPELVDVTILLKRPDDSLSPVVLR